MIGAGRGIARTVAIGTAVLIGAVGLAGQADAARKAPKVNAKADYVARGSVGELYVKDADPGQKLMLVNSRGQVAREGTADSYGSKIFYFLREGAKFRVLSRKSGKVMGTPEITVRKRESHPRQSFYERQDLEPGLNYIRMRDGVELAVTVRLPRNGLEKLSLEDGPFPTIIEYSGYQVAAPNDLIDSLLASLSGGGGGSDPLAPATSTAVGSVIMPLTGFATVSVQMRGSGCSGGAFDLFGLPTVFDAYDVIETVATQDWVKGGRVGMAGISFSGISQLLAGGTRAPHLAALTPLSVTDDVYNATGYPGGIFNNGFAYSWISERARDAEPAPEGGQAYARILADPTSEFYNPKCAANQDLRLQTRNFENMIQTNPYRTPELFRERAPGYWVNKIKVPTFLVGSFQDEQTGGHFVNSLGRFRDNPNVWLTLQNGVHSDSLGPSTIVRQLEFLQLFVDKSIPRVPELLVGLSGTLFDQLTGAPALPVTQSRFADYTSYSQALVDFKKDPRVRLLMDNGAAVPGKPGAIGGAWELGYDAWPIREVSPTTWYLADNGGLAQQKPASETEESYIGDPEARPSNTITDGSEWAAQPNYDWAPLADGKGLGFVSPVLGSDAVIAGNSSVDLWLKSSAVDTDLQVTLTEARSDGKEVLVQNGWLRASHRKLDPKQSTALKPVPTHLEKDAANLPSGQYALVRVPIFPVAHAFRQGSRIRLNIQAPGGDRQIWKFATIEDGSTTNTIGIGGRYASKIVLPLLPGVDAQGVKLANGTVGNAPAPAFNALRGQSWRDYEPASNGG